MVHRALITGLKFGPDGLSPADAVQFPDIAEQITATERRATLAERDSTDRYLALYLQHRVGESFTGRVSGVTKFGLFVTLPENGASGFLSMSNLPDDYWVHDEATQSLIGRRSRRSFQLAQSLNVRLIEARPVTGGLLFAIGAQDIARTGAEFRGPRPPFRGKQAGTRATGPKPKRKSKHPR
ncbi:MAG: S1 RNA-binding domain-containing protein [Acidocella sp.]|nr:S1 RNA-binding domain-containing protein [Acidocella sp.]